MYYIIYSILYNTIELVFQYKINIKSDIVDIMTALELHV